LSPAHSAVGGCYKLNSMSFRELSPGFELCCRDPPELDGGARGHLCTRASEAPSANRLELRARLYLIGVYTVGPLNRTGQSEDGFAELISSWERCRMLGSGKHHRME
jgi:hypothetical protein